MLQGTQPVRRRARAYVRGSYNSLTTPPQIQVGNFNQTIATLQLGGSETAIIVSIVICSVLLLLSVVGKERPPPVDASRGRPAHLALVPSEDRWVGERCDGPGSLTKGVERVKDRVPATAPSVQGGCC